MTFADITFLFSSDNQTNEHLNPPQPSHFTPHCILAGQAPNLTLFFTLAELQTPHNNIIAL
jgi:hypothetical protein